MEKFKLIASFLWIPCLLLLVSFSTPLLAQTTLESRISTALAEEGLTGAAWAVRYSEQRVEYGHVGFRDNENQLPFKPETRFHVGSVSKALLATGVLRLVSTGEIDLDEPAEKHLTGLVFDNPWVVSNPVTVRHLLDHTAGLDDARLWQMFSTRIGPDTPLEEAFNTQPDTLKIRARPGSRFSYSNMGYALLGIIIEQVTGEAYERYLDRELLIPLGMSDSSFRFTTQLGDDADPLLAWGHIGDGSRYPAAPIMLRPAGQFTTTSADWLRFATFLMGDGTLNGDQFLDRELMKARGVATTTLAARAGLEVGYSMGLSKIDRYGAIGLCHSGNIVGFSAMMCVYPDSGQAFVISFNTDSETANYRSIHEILASELSFASVPEPVSVLPPEDAADWQGVFILQPNRFETFRYLDLVFGFTRLAWRGNALILNPLQGPERQLRPTGEYLLSANDRRMNSHVLIRDANQALLLSDGYRTYARANALVIYGLWLSLGVGIAGLLWFVFIGGIMVARKGLPGFLSAPGLALTGVLGLLLPIPVFFTQSFMALGDMTPASLMLAAATVFLPLTMLAAFGKSVLSKPRNTIDKLHMTASVAVLQWCVVLYFFDLLPLRLWV